MSTKTLWTTPPPSGGYDIDVSNKGVSLYVIPNGEYGYQTFVIPAPELSQSLNAAYVKYRSLSVGSLYLRFAITRTSSTGIATQVGTFALYAGANAAGNPALITIPASLVALFTTVAEGDQIGVVVERDSSAATGSTDTYEQDFEIISVGVQFNTSDAAIVSGGSGIITLAEVKSILQIATTTYDTLISYFIPIAQKNIVRHCKNFFLDPNYYLEADTIAFVSGSPATITDSDEGFVDAYFFAGMNLHIIGSQRNKNIIVNVASVAAGTLTLTTTETLNAEAAGNTIRLTQVDFPEEIKPDVAFYIKWLLEKSGKLEKNESLPGGYSVSYLTEEEVLARFNNHRKPYW